jgi:hypothetical protein
MIFTALIIPASAQAGLLCSVKTSCSTGETEVFHMSDLGNAHAELATQGNYPYKVCCGGAPGLTTDCNQPGSEIILKLSQVTNAHAERSDLANYPNSVCLYSSGGEIHCGYSTSCTNLGSNYACVATISADTNAHVSDCDGQNDYSIRVCCEYADKTPPTTSISQDGISWTGQNVPFALSCFDGVGILCQSTYYKIIDDGQNCGTTGFSTGDGDTVTCSQGSVCLKMVCYYSTDDSGNQESVKTSNVFSIDKKPPVTTDNSDDNWHGGDVTVTLSCSDASESECKKTYYCTYNEGGTPCDPVTGGTEGRFVTVSCTGSCRKVIRYYSTDNADNSELPHDSKTVKIDTSLPSCVLAPLSEYTKSATIGLSWTASGASISNVTIEKSETGTWEFLYVSTSSTGSYDFTGGQNGHAYSFKCVARNALAAEGYSSSVSTAVDTQSPIVSIQAQPYTNATSFAVSWSGSDGESGIANYTVRYMSGTSEYSLWNVFNSQTTSASFGENGLPVFLQSNTTYTFNATAMDMAGNTKYSNEVAVLVDTGKPSCAIQDMPAKQPLNEFIVSWSGSDGESGINEYIVEQRIGTSLWSQLYRGAETSKEILGAQDGTYRFRCRSVDSAGNLGDISPEKNTTIDMNPPEAQISFSSAVYVNENINIDATVTDAIRVSSVELYYDNKAVSGIATQNPNYSVWNVTWTIYDLVSTGMKTFIISVQDVNGNTRNYTNQFLVAFCAPGEIQQGCKCGTGTKTCRSDGTWGECTNVTKEPRPEVCNGEDDDCNWIVDDVGGGYSVQLTQCQCYNSSLLAAKSELCNGIDDDCDGQIDEGANCCDDGNTQQCGSDVGICSDRKKTCNEGIWGPCEWEQGPNPGGEICGNNLDDDCDGSVDENCASCSDRDGDGYGDPASSKCAYTGQDCDDLDPDANPGMLEVCDGIDNDCDGQIDEDMSCETCSNGVQDWNEDGVDCGGDCPPCFVWGWLFLTAGGVVILLIIVFVWFHFMKQGRKLTWEELNKKWTK